MSYRGFGLTLSQSGSATMSKTSSPFVQKTPLLTSRGLFTPKPKPVVVYTPPSLPPTYTSHDPVTDAAFRQQYGIWFLRDEARAALYAAMMTMQWVEQVPGPGMLVQAAAVAIAPGSLSVPIGNANEKLQGTLSGTGGLVLIDKLPPTGASVTFYFPKNGEVAGSLIYGPDAKYAVVDGTPDALAAQLAAGKFASQGGPAPATCPTGQVMVDGKCVAVEKPSVCPTPPGGVPCAEPAVWDTGKCECVLPQDKQPANVGGGGGETPKWVIPVVAGLGAVALIAVVVAATKKGG